MNSAKRNLLYFFILIIVMALMYSLSYGFTTAQQPTGNKAASAPLPAYKVGTTFIYSDGSYSRRYVQRLSLPDGQQTYYGMAVRDSSGVWGIPRR